MRPNNNYVAFCINYVYCCCYNLNRFQYLGSLHWRQILFQHFHRISISYISITCRLPRLHKFGLHINSSYWHLQSARAFWFDEYVIGSSNQINYYRSVTVLGDGIIQFEGGFVINWTAPVYGPGIS